MFRLLAVFLVAALVGAGAGLWLHNGLTLDLEAASVPSEISSTGDFTPAGGLSPSDGAMAVDCDGSAPGIQTDCTYANGDTFSIQIHATEAPEVGYGSFQTDLRWTQGILRYLPTNPADEVLWPDCSPPFRVDLEESAPSVVHWCVKFGHVSSFTGAILELALRCEVQSGDVSDGTTMDLISRQDNPDYGSIFTDIISVDTAIIKPTLTGAQVTCAGDPLLPSHGAMAVDCNGNVVGIQTECSYMLGTNFAVEVHVTEIPLQQGTPPYDGYQGFQAKLHWSDGDVLTYNPTTSPGGEIVWPDCGFPARAPLDPDPTEVLSACQLLFTGLSTYTGAVLRFEFQCKDGLSPPDGMSTANVLSSDQSLMILIPRPGDPQGGTHMTDLQNVAIDPALTGATVTCVPDPDKDGDGCTDAQELGSNSARGGQRDSNNFWDFFDTPNSANVRDRAITIADIGRVVQRFGTSGTLPLSLEEQVQAALSPPPSAGFHPAFDRTPVGPELWNIGPPNGGVTIQDIGLIVAQFGHSCVQ